MSVGCSGVLQRRKTVDVVSLIGDTYVSGKIFAWMAGLENLSLHMFFNHEYYLVESLRNPCSPFFECSKKEIKEL